MHRSVKTELIPHADLLLVCDVQCQPCILIFHLSNHAQGKTGTTCHEPGYSVCIQYNNTVDTT